MEEQDPSFKGRALFKGRDISWGIFYPTGYIVTIFDSLEDAQRAKGIMRSAGYAEDEVDAVPSEYVIADIEEGTKNPNLLKRVRQTISKAIGKEADFWEEDLRWAREGAGFLVVHCPTDIEATRVVRLLEPMNPKKMRRYGPAAIEELIR